MNASVADAARTLALSALDCLALAGDRLLVKRPFHRDVVSLLRAT
jgi:hypothetical protein